jgi:DNA-binding NtrC family response regulator
MPAERDTPLAGLRVLVVEDDFLVAKSLATLLGAMKCEVVGPASTADEALVLIKSTPIDAALLDIRLSPGTSEPVARALRYRGCPFVFITGFGNLGALPDDLRGYRVLHKPVDLAMLESSMREMLKSGTSNS